MGPASAFKIGARPIFDELNFGVSFSVRTEIQVGELSCVCFATVFTDSIGFGRHVRLALVHLKWQGTLDRFGREPILFRKLGFYVHHDA